MKCNQCQQADTKVIESRDVADGEAIRRRRACTRCSHRFTTYERLERPQLVVIKTSGLRELFDRQKLLAGLYRACEKTTVTNLQLERLVNDIEKELQSYGEPEVRTAVIGDLIMDRLAQLNEVAYVRFASVYRKFKDITGFEKELSDIRQRKTTQIISR
ncbi:MAG TPA: transcriptional regulator NrdR [Candidatus Saccharimonadales bacterium]|nr:transcriptional regulator NrdR [Candidatus Saccharimonadales bacterium]